MPEYRMLFDTQAGMVESQVHVEEQETLQEVLPDILSGLEQYGYRMKGGRDGAGDIACFWEGNEIDLYRKLVETGVRPNDLIRVGTKPPTLLLRRQEQTVEITERTEMHEGDDLIIGRTILRFHVRGQQRTHVKGQTFYERLQQGRSFQQTGYFMSLVGAMAGLACWFFFSLIDRSQELSVMIYDIVNFSLLGLFIGGLTVGFNDHWAGGAVARWILAAAFIGALAGALGGTLAPFTRWAIPQIPWLADILAWSVTGVLIGLGVSLRWVEINRNRILHGVLGGLTGGALGGASYWVLTDLIGGDVAQAIGLMLTGAGITLGISLAPILLRQGMLEFINSRDPAVMKKYAQSRKQWEIHEGGKYVIGSLSAAQTMTMFQPELSIYIPDRNVAQRHAILLSREHHYFIEPHPDLSRRP